MSDKKKNKFLKDLKRIDTVHKLFKGIVLKIVLKNKNVNYEGCELPEGSNLILSNHVSPFDYAYILKAFEKRTISFVAGEDAFKNKLIRFLVVRYVGIIVHMRGKNELKTTKEMIKRLGAGMNVMIFPEGSSSFDGRTTAVGVSIAKVARMCGANLVLLRNEGGYLVKPRWATVRRQGPVNLNMKVITKEELVQMSPQQILNEINSELYYDAYEAQKRIPIAYHGKDMACGLECAVYQCPKCKAINKTLHTIKNKIYCDCGFNAMYDDYGYLNCDDGRKYAVSDFTDKQKDYLKKQLNEVSESGEHKLLFEEELTTFRLYPDGKRGDAVKVHIKTFTDRIEYRTEKEEGTIKLTQVKSVFIFIRNKLIVFLDGLDYGYEFYGDFSTSALKYKDLFELIKESKELVVD